MSVGILLNHGGKTYKDTVILEGNTLYGDLAGSAISKYQSGNVSGWTVKWQNGLYSELGTYSGDCRGTWVFDKPVDLTHFKKLEITVGTFNQTGSGSGSYSVGWNDGNNGNEWVAGSYASWNNLSTGVKTVDISSVRGRKYIRGRMVRNGWAGITNITKIRLLVD